MRLTKDEILLVVAVLLVFVGGATVRHYRQHHPPVPGPVPTTERQ